MTTAQPSPIDILSFVCLPQATTLTSSWSDGSYDSIDQAGKWYRVKNKQGWPWDIKLYDDHFVYDWITEQNWTSPRDYKKFVGNHPDATGKPSDGVKMFPRFVTLAGAVSPSWVPPVISQIVTPSAQTTFRIFTNCKWDNVTHNLGDIEHTLLGPVGFDHGGNVGYVPTLVHQYKWNGKAGVYGVMEENLYALNFGWVRWTLYNAQAGTWQQANQSIHNQLVPTAPASIQFPCF